jgi:hypothetical protein
MHSLLIEKRPPQWLLCITVCGVVATPLPQRWRVFPGGPDRRLIFLNPTGPYRHLGLALKSLVQTGRDFEAPFKTVRSRASSKPDWPDYWEPCPLPLCFSFTKRHLLRASLHLMISTRLRSLAPSLRRMIAMSPASPHLLGTMLALGAILVVVSTSLALPLGYIIL